MIIDNGQSEEHDFGMWLLGSIGFALAFLQTKPKTSAQQRYNNDHPNSVLPVKTDRHERKRDSFDKFKKTLYISC
jgi:hypothetical protein